MIDLPAMTQVGLHWLRPWWLLALLPLLIGVVFWWRRQGPSHWDELVDPALQPYVLEGEGVNSRRANLLLIAIWAMTIVLLAGPVFEQRQAPLTEARRSEVVLMDLTRSMVTDDLAPSRLARARFKLDDLFDRVDDEQLALVAFAERPYVISPLTDDIQTLSAFIPSLDPSLMPVQGSRLDLAILKGQELLDGAGVRRGHLLLITDGQPGPEAMDAAERIAEAGHVLSVLAVGTRSGAPIKDPAGGFLNDDQGQIIIPRLDLDALGALARAGGGVITQITNGDEDLDLLAQARARATVQTDGGQAESDAALGLNVDAGSSRSWQWVERTPWLIPVLALLYLSLFRRESRT